MVRNVCLYSFSLSFRKLVRYQQMRNRYNRRKNSVQQGVVHFMVQIKLIVPLVKPNYLKLIRTGNKNRCRHKNVSCKDLLLQNFEERSSPPLLQCLMVSHTRSLSIQDFRLLFSVQRNPPLKHLRPMSHTISSEVYCNND